MYRGLIQEAEDSFASKGFCSSLVEGHYGSSSAPTVARGIHRLSILVGHVPGNQVAAVVGAVQAALSVLGTALVGSDTARADTGSVALGPEVSAQTGIGDSSLISASVELRPVLCHQ